MLKIFGDLLQKRKKRFFKNLHAVLAKQGFTNSTREFVFGKFLLARRTHIKTFRLHKFSYA